VRWVHVSELADIAGLLSGGELILTTGIALPEDDASLRAYLGELAHAGASGLVIELGRRFREIPPVLVQAAERHGLPLVALHRETRFVAVTEAVHAIVLNEQLTALRASEAAHEAFTSLSVQGAPVSRILSELRRMAGCPAVFENLIHQVLAFDGGDVPAEELLSDWESRSRSIRVTGRTSWAAEAGWLLTSVETRGETWGRLVLLPDGEPSAHHVTLLDRAATALTLNRLLERSRETVERSAHRSTLSDIVERRYRTAQEMHARTDALGVRTAGRRLVAVVVDRIDEGPNDGHASVRDADAERVAETLRRLRQPALVATLSPGRVGILVSLPPSSPPERALTGLAAGVHDGADLDRRRAVIAVGSTVSSLDEVPRSFDEAGHVAHAARVAPSDKPYYGLPDIQLRGLLLTLSGDPRLQAFVERTLGSLLAHDAAHGTDLLGALRANLTHPGNKSAAAQHAHLSRQAFYKRLEVIERLLDVDLGHAETSTSLHAAVMALDSARGPYLR
jgi:purine catabolism regulator